MHIILNNMMVIIVTVGLKLLYNAPQRDHKTTILLTANNMIIIII